MTFSPHIYMKTEFQLFMNYLANHNPLSLSYFYSLIDSEVRKFCGEQLIIVLQQYYVRVVVNYLGKVSFFAILSGIY